MLDRIRAAYNKRKFIKEEKAVIKDMLSSEPNIDDCRYIPIPDIVNKKYTDESILGQATELCEKWSDSRLKIYPDLNLTDRANGPKCIGIKIKWNF